MVKSLSRVVKGEMKYAHNKAICWEKYFGEVIKSPLNIKAHYKILKKCIS